MGRFLGLFVLVAAIAFALSQPPERDEQPARPPPAATMTAFATNLPAGMVAVPMVHDTRTGRCIVYPEGLGGSGLPLPQDECDELLRASVLVGPVGSRR